MVKLRHGVIALYALILAANFLWIPWRPSSSLPVHFRAVKLRAGLLWKGPVKYATDDYRYSFACEGAQPSLPLICLRSLAITALAMGALAVIPKGRHSRELAGRLRRTAKPPTFSQRE